MICCIHFIYVLLMYVFASIYLLFVTPRCYQECSKHGTVMHSYVEARQPGGLVYVMFSTIGAATVSGGLVLSCLVLSSPVLSCLFLSHFRVSSDMFCFLVRCSLFPVLPCLGLGAAWCGMLASWWRHRRRCWTAVGSPEGWCSWSISPLMWANQIPLFSHVSQSNTPFHVSRTNAPFLSQEPIKHSHFSRKPIKRSNLST